MPISIENAGAETGKEGFQLPLASLQSLKPTDIISHSRGTESHAPKFGTSGLRGLVSELTPKLVASYVRGFIAACPHGSAIHVGWDLRPSSPMIAEIVLQTVQACGITAVRCGPVPTPALALGAMNADCGAIMITGSHIPADRNGLKFYVPSGGSF